MEEQFGNGSDGDLIVSSGTVDLSLDRKYQYNRVEISSGAIVQAIANGSVLYITAKEEIVIDGALNAWNSVIGANNKFVTIDGVIYHSPSVAPGGSGGASDGLTRSSQGNGYGGGGSGGSVTNANGGAGGTGGASPVGGAIRQLTNSGAQYLAGFSGSSSGGGSGAVGTNIGTLQRSSAGASSHGADAPLELTTHPPSFGYWSAAGGGGGGGGVPGVPGVHIVLKSPKIIIRGIIRTRGGSYNGQKGGNGSQRLGAGDIPMFRDGSGGGGGGGTNAGNLYITSPLLSYNPSAVGMTGGIGGAGGTGYQNGGAGQNGVAGNVFLDVPVVNYSAFNVWDGSQWLKRMPKVYDGSNWVDRKAKGL